MRHSSEAVHAKGFHVTGRGSSGSVPHRNPLGYESQWWPYRSWWGPATMFGMLTMAGLALLVALRTERRINHRRGPTWPFDSN